MPYRKILHIDMDAFYASVEQRDNPQLRGKPIAVGGNRLRGVVAAASYEARRYGVRSAMPSVTAARQCPNLIFVKPRFEVYRQVSEQIREIFYRYTPLVEPLSLDEAYLDVSEPLQGPPSGTRLAELIRQEIKDTTGLNASAGVSYCKFLAKLASDFEKPNGLTVILPDQALDFLAALPIEKFYGIGKVTAEKMRRQGILTGSDLRRQSQADLSRWFGKAGAAYYKLVRGIDERPVMPDRVRKSLGAESTFMQDLTTFEEMEEALKEIADEVAGRLAKRQLEGRTLTLKVKLSDFTQLTRSRTYHAPISDAQSLWQQGGELLRQALEEPSPVRLLGLSMSGFANELGQLRIPFRDS